jgi:hypothetical protein
MTRSGTFKIEYSFKLSGRGLVAVGQIIEGRIHVGDFLSFHTGINGVTMKISGVEFVDSSQKFAVGLIFAYENEIQRKEFEALNLKEQIADIKTATPGPNSFSPQQPM